MRLGIGDRRIKALGLGLTEDKLSLIVGRSTSENSVIISVNPISWENWLKVCYNFPHSFLVFNAQIRGFVNFFHENSSSVFLVDFDVEVSTNLYKVFFEVVRTRFDQFGNWRRSCSGRVTPCRVDSAGGHVVDDVVVDVDAVVVDAVVVDVDVVVVVVIIFGQRLQRGQ